MLMVMHLVRQTRPTKIRTVTIPLHAGQMDCDPLLRIIMYIDVILRLAMEVATRPCSRGHSEYTW